MALVARLRRSSKIHDDVAARFGRWLPRGRILDLPCGKGENARRLRAAGYDVVGADLDPSLAEGQGFPVEKVDLAEPLPFADGSFDGVLCSECIEHLDAQVASLAELARVLRPGGVLVIATPNLLHLEGRIATLLTGHAYRNRTIVVETSAYWGSRAQRAHPTRGAYFGHVFLINLFQLRFYLVHVGLEVLEVDTTRWSWRSVALWPLLTPWIALSTRRLLRNPRSNVPPDLRREIARQVLSPAALLGKKLVLTARKPACAASRA
jgi:SAM-dependent methyltransferase